MWLPETELMLWYVAWYLLQIHQALQQDSFKDLWKSWFPFFWNVLFNSCSLRGRNLALNFNRSSCLLHLKGLQLETDFLRSGISYGVGRLCRHIQHPVYDFLSVVFVRRLEGDEDGEQMVTKCIRFVTIRFEPYAIVSMYWRLTERLSFNSSR